MNAINIILILVAAIIGALITYFFVKGKSSNIEATNQQNELIESQQAQIAEAQKSASMLAEQKEKAEQLLEKTKKELAELDGQFKAFMSSDKVDPGLMQEFADTDKLKKKIKDLEGQLEDAEDDLDDAEKKLKNKTAELSEVNQKYDKLETEYQKTVKEVGDIRSELNQKKEELELKMGSLEFVQSILSAPEVKNSATNELFKKIDDISRFVEDEIYGYISKTFDDGSNEFKTGLAESKEGLRKWEATQKKNWIAGKTAIAFIGEFSAGKTSIVNRILSQDKPGVHLLPVSTKATTAIPTYISGGIKTDYLFFTHDNRLKTIKESDFNRVTKEVLDQVNGVSNLIQYFVMSYRNENLNNLSILDTPGFNSNDEEDATRTLDVINECDALFWVFDVNAGTVNKTSINLIKEHLKKPLYVVINKVDTKSKSEVDKVEMLIKDTFAREQITVNGYIRFSAKAPLDEIMIPIKQVNKTDESINFMEEGINEFNDFIQEMKKEVKELKNEHDQWQSQANNCTDRYNQAISLLLGNCEEAVGIPQPNEYVVQFWKDPDFKMSQGQYNRLIDLLNAITQDRTNELVNLYNEQMNNQQSLQLAYGNWKEAEFLTKQGEELLSRWQKLLKTIKQ
ncbi:MAG: dynamin family protein [Muribaculaceae bacterium]|nr:dynamin family protein [Muribaculaceae bacterium]